MENFVLPRMPVCGICIYVPYALNPESARKTLQTQLKKGNSCLEELAIHR